MKKMDLFFSNVLQSHVQMINNRTITVVLPAYNAEKTLEQTYREIPFDIVDHVILVDDRSRDKTPGMAEELGIRHIIPAC